MVFTMTVSKDAVFPEGLGPTVRLDEELLRPGFANAPTDSLPLDQVQTPLDTPRDPSSMSVAVPKDLPKAPAVQEPAHVPGVITDSSDTILMPRDAAGTPEPTTERPVDRSLSLEVIVDEEDDDKTQ